MTGDAPSAAAQFWYLQDVMEQGDAALVGFGLCELQQGVDLETHSIPRVTSLEGKPVAVSAGLAQRPPEIKISALLRS